MASSIVTFEGAALQFEVENPDDHIQAHHARGEFYEIRQLLAQRDLIPMHGTVIDIGANIGNHTLFYARHSWAGRVYPFEPNPHARRILARNVAANGPYRAVIDLRHVELAIGSKAGWVEALEGASNNLGGTQFVAGREDGSIRCVRLDQLEFEGRVVFLKIDVEGMEMEALHGAEGLIARFRPLIAIEIVERQEAAFWAWVKGSNYCVVGMFVDYLYYKNYTLAPMA